jgi:hypothetical protein
MMKFIAGGAFSIVVNKDSSYVYFICRDKLNHHDRFYKTDLDSTLEVSIEEYAQIKFGNAWRTIHSAYTECVRLDNEEYLTCFFQSSVILRHNQDGMKIHTYGIAPIQTGFDTIYSITVDGGNNLWLTQPSCHYIGQYDLNTEKLLFKIGGDEGNPEPFNFPEQVRAYAGYVYISDMGNQRVCKLDITTKELTIHLTFNEPTWEYAQFRGREFIRLTSGLYII